MRLFIVGAFLIGCGGSHSDKGAAQSPNAESNDPAPATTNSTPDTTNTDGGTTPNVNGVSGELRLFAGGLGGSGYADGIGSAARFALPSALAIANDGSLLVADSPLFRQVTSDGRVTTIQGDYLSFGSAIYLTIGGVATTSTGEIYFTDTENCSIYKIDATSRLTRILGSGDSFSCGITDGKLASALAGYPVALALDSAGNLYFTDGNTIRKISTGGDVTTIAGDDAGSANAVDGQGTNARFLNPNQLLIDGSGNLIVADLFSIRKIDSHALVTTLLTNAQLATAANASKSHAFTVAGIAFDHGGNLYVASGSYGVVLKMTPNHSLSLFAGDDAKTGIADGTAGAARLGSLFALTSDAHDNLYVVDGYAIREITPSAVVTTLAGENAAAGNQDGTGAQATFGLPIGIAVDHEGNYYLADEINRDVRKVTPQGVVSTLVQSGTFNFDFAGQTAIAVDSMHNVFVAEGSAIRKIGTDGKVVTLAGSFDKTGLVNGTGIAARFGTIASLAVDSHDNLFVAESDNCTIRKVTQAGVTSTFAGTSFCIHDDGAAGRFIGPTALTIDDHDTLYVLDGDDQLRTVDGQGVVTTLPVDASVFNYNSGQTLAWAGHDTIYALSGSAVIRVKVNGETSTVLAEDPNSSGVLLGTLQAARLNAPYGIAIAPDGSLGLIDENALLEIVLN